MLLKICLQFYCNLVVLSNKTTMVTTNQLGCFIYIYFLLAFKYSFYIDK